MILNYLEDIITSLDPTYIRVGNGMRLQRIAKLYELNCLIHHIANVPWEIGELGVYSFIDWRP